MAAKTSTSGYRLLVTAAVLGTLAWLGWAAYEGLVLNRNPGDYAYHAGSNYFADGYYDQALREYQQALLEDPDHLAAKRGQAETLIQLKQERAAIESFDELIELEPENPSLYANRGIAYDRLGEHQAALNSYDQALRLDSEIGEGPSWLTRFLRKQSEKPPGVADRAAYLRAQLALPPGERQLRQPELDQAQRPHKK